MEQGGTSYTKKKDRVSTWGAPRRGLKVGPRKTDRDLGTESLLGCALSSDPVRRGNRMGPGRSRAARPEPMPGASLWSLVTACGRGLHPLHHIGPQLRSLEARPRRGSARQRARPREEFS